MWRNSLSVALAATVLLTSSLPLPAPPVAQADVVTCTNCSNMFVQAKQMLESTNQTINQVRMIQNQLQQVTTMTQNTASIPDALWNQISPDVMNNIRQVHDLYRETRSLTSNVASLSQDFQRTYRTIQSNLQGGVDFKTQYQTLSNQTLRDLENTLKGVGMHQQQLQSQQATLNHFQQMARTAQGRKAALDAANAMTQYALQQNQQTQQLLTMQLQMQAQYYAAEEARRAASQAASDRLNSGRILPVTGGKAY